MDHVKFGSKILEIYKLIWNKNVSPDQLADFIDQDPQGLKEYLARNEDWSHLDDACWNPLYAAAKYGRAEILSLLLSKYGMAVNGRYEKGIWDSTNALTVATAWNEVKCVRILLQHGADIETGGIYSDTSFKNAAELDRLCKAGKIDRFNCVNSRDDSIKNLLLEEEAARRRRGKRESENLREVK